MAKFEDEEKIICLALVKPTKLMLSIFSARVFLNALASNQ